MPKPKALRPEEARRTLAARFAGSRESPGLADRLRQLHTKFGLRSQRVFLVWTQFTGDERGEGDEQQLARIEILPTPRVDSASIAYNPFSAGKYPTGTLRISEVSATLTKDQLVGLLVPGHGQLTDRIDFFYEVVEDGRGDALPSRDRYRLLNEPELREGNVGWTLLLERAAEDRDRRGRSQIAGQFP